MEYVLVNIKNFLKRLENGQLEIEAGQWQLQKTVADMNKAVCDLQELKEDVEDMKLNSEQQMGLIKELQMKLDRFSQLRDEEPVTVSESGVQYEGVFKLPADDQTTPKGFKKRKCRIHSEEIIEITSQVSDEKTESERIGSICTGTGQLIQTENECKGIPNIRISDSEGGSSRNVYEEGPDSVPALRQTTSQYPIRKNDILQRYLKDSANYIDRKTSKLSKSSYTSNGEKSSEAEYRPFWDEYGSRGSSESYYDDQDSKARDRSMTLETPVENVIQKRFSCPKCSRKFMLKADFLNHEKKHRLLETVCYCKMCGKAFGSRDGLREHKMVHRVSSRSFKGFKCSYCSKICSSPEKLTAHLRKCRIIVKSHYRKNYSISNSSSVIE